MAKMKKTTQGNARVSKSDLFEDIALFEEEKTSTRSLCVRMNERKMNEEKLYCSVCGKKISKEEYESYDGLCWECWDDQMTEECEFEEDII